MADALVLGTSSNGVGFDPFSRKNDPKLRLGVIFILRRRGVNSTAARRGKQSSGATATTAASG